MIDIHCHILHRFDDGSSSLEESLAMARMAVDTGVTEIVATPHFPGEKGSLASLPKLMDRYRELSQAIDQVGIPLKLHLGAEILCLTDTAALAREKMLPTIGDTPYFLTEFFFDESFSYMDDMLSQLFAAGYIPVVAHPERYGAIRRDPLLLDRWFRRGYVLQLNKGSILGAFGHRVKQASETILQAGLAHIIASDAHSASHRTTHMGELKHWMEYHLEPGYARILIEDNPKRLVRGQEMVPVE